MRVRYYFCNKYSEELIGFLKKNEIKYNASSEDPRWALITFNIWSTNKRVNTILADLEAMNVHKPIVYSEYSKAELEKAKLLMITPQKQHVEIKNYQEAYLYFCKWKTEFGVSKVMHAEQIDDFEIKKEPSMKSSTAFWLGSIGFDELFVDRRVRDLVERYSLKGVGFRKVYLKPNQCSENIFQLTTENEIGREVIEMGHGEEKVVCPVCGKVQYFINNAYQLYLNFSDFEGLDFCKTERMWGQGIAYPIYIISQRFYQLLKKENLANNVAFAPIVDVSYME